MAGRLVFAALFVAVASLVSESLVAAAEPGWVPVVVARGEYRQHLQSLPIEERPNRPLHFYGNAVRRQHRRAATRPAVRGASPRTAGVFLRAR